MSWNGTELNLLETEDGVRATDLKIGDRVMVFDYRLFVDDKKTPLSFTVRPATITRIDLTTRPNEPMVDVHFDHHSVEQISHGHFVWGIKKVVDNS